MAVSLSDPDVPGTRLLGGWGMDQVLPVSSGSGFRVRFPGRRANRESVETCACRLSDLGSRCAMNKLLARMSILAVLAGESLWGQSVLPGQASPAGDGGYPGLRALSLSYSAQADEADFLQLASTTRWVVEHGGWEQHRDALDKGLVAAALAGSEMQAAGNMERILTVKTPSVMLAQDTVLHEIDPSTLGNLSMDPATQGFLIWLFTNPRAITLLGETFKPQDKPQRVLENTGAIAGRTTRRGRKNIWPLRWRWRWILTSR